MGNIIIETKNPNDITPEEAETFAEDIRSKYPKYEVQVLGSGYTGYGVTWYEIINIWLVTTITKQLLEQISKIFIDWARQRFLRMGSKRPMSITIYGPNGKALKSIVVKNANDEPEFGLDNIAKKYRIKPPINKINFWRRFFKSIFKTKQVEEKGES